MKKNISNILAIIIFLNYLFSPIVSVLALDNEAPETENLGGPNQNPIPVEPGTAPENIIANVVNNTTTIGKLASINSKVLNMNEFDQKKIEEWNKIGSILALAKEKNHPLWQEYVKAGYTLTPEITKQMGVNYEAMSKYDVRTLESLSYLSTAKQYGGAGRENLKISSITKGYNVRPGNSKSMKDKSGKLVDEWTIEEDPESANYYSSHSNQFGQAVDITEIDSVRGSAFIYDQDDKLVKVTKLPNNIPISVSWQTEYRPNNGPFSLAQSRELLSSSFLNMFSGGINAAFNSLTGMLASDADILNELPQDNTQVNSDNLTQMTVKNLGLVSYIQELDLPKNFEPGYDLGDNGKKMGQLIVNSLSGNNLVASGLEGNDYREFELNAGREWIGQALGLPANTLSSTNSNDLIKTIGRRTLEEKLNLSKDSLSNLSSGNTELLIGRGYITNILNLPPGSFDENKKSFNDIKNAIGVEKTDYLFKDPGFIDRLLGIDGGSSEKLKNGQISPDAYAQLVGGLKVASFNEAFSERPDLFDAILGISQGNMNLDEFGDDANKQKQWVIDNYTFSTQEKILDENVAQEISVSDYFNKYYNTKFANNKSFLYSFLNKYATRNGSQNDGQNNLAQKFLSGDQSVFYEAGIRTLVRVLDSNQDMWEYYEKWLRQGKDSEVNTLADVKEVNLTSKDNVPVIYSDYVNDKFSLQQGDLERMFILNRAEEVYRRYGRLKIDDALKQININDDTELVSAPTFSVDYYLNDFYKNKFEDILNSDQFKKILSNPQSKQDAQMMQNIIGIALNYQEQNEDDFKYKRRMTLYVNTFDQLQQLLVNIVKNTNTDPKTIEILRFKINDLIEGKNIENPKDFKKENIKENFSNYYITYGSFKDIVDVINDKISINDYTRNIGFTIISDQMLNYPDGDVLGKAYKSISSSAGNYEKSNSIIRSVVQDEFLNDQAGYLNSIFDLNKNKISGDDVLNILNGNYHHLCLKIGSMVGDGSYQTSDFYDYSVGKKSADELLSSVQSPYKTNEEIFNTPQVKSIFGLFSDKANIYSLGMDIVSSYTNVDIKGLFNKSLDITKNNGIGNIGNFIDDAFGKLNIKEGEKDKVTRQLIVDLLAGNISNFVNRIRANDLAKNIKSLMPDMEIDSKDFMPPNILDQVLKFVGDSNFNANNLKIPGYFSNKFAEANFTSTQKPYLYGLFSQLRNTFGDKMDFKSFESYFSKLMNPNTSPEEMKKVYADFLNQAGYLDSIPEEYRETIKTFLSGDINENGVATLIKDVWLKDATDETKNIVGGILDIGLMRDNINPEKFLESIQKIGLFKNMDDTDKGRFEAAIGLLGSVQNGNIDPQKLFDSMLDMGMFKNMSKEDEGRFKAAIGLLGSVQNGNIDPQKLFDSMLDMGMFKNMSKEDEGRFKAAIGLLGSVQNGNINPTQLFDSMLEMGLFEKMSDADKAKYKGALELVTSVQSGNYNASTMYNSLDKMGLFGDGKTPESKKQKETYKGVFELVGMVQSGNFNASTAFNSLDKMGLFGDGKTPEAKKQKETYKGAFELIGMVQSGNFNASTAFNSLDKMGLFGDGKTPEAKKQKETYQGAFELIGMMQSGNFNASTTFNSLDKMGLFGDGKTEASKQQKETYQGVFEIVGMVQSGSFNPNTVFNALDKFGAFGKGENAMSKEAKEKIQSQIGLLEILNGDINPKTITKFLEKNTKIFAGMKTGQIDAIAGVIGMGLDGNFDVKQIALLGAQYFGFTGIKIGDWGLITPQAMINAFSNPESLAITLATQYLKHAITGMLTNAGIAAGPAGIIAAVAITLLLSLFNKGGGRVEYRFTACGYYPGYGAWLSEVNTAKRNALLADQEGDSQKSAQAWGEYVNLRYKYNTIPSDEILEDDMMTRDITYSPKALHYEDTKAIEENGLSGVVNWAKTKDNTPLKCYDMGSNGVFVNQEAQLSEDQKKQIAKYKIRVLLGNLIRMGEKTASSTTNNFLDSSGIAQTTSYNISDEFYSNIMKFADINKANAQNSSPTQTPVRKQKYQYTLNFNASGQDLTPTQLFTFGGDNNYKELTKSNYETGTDAYSPIKTNQSTTQEDNNLFYNKIASVIKSITKTAKAEDVNNTSNPAKSDYYSEDDIAWFYVYRDRLWGDDAGSPGSQDINLVNGSRDGFGFSKRMYDRIYYGF